VSRGRGAADQDSTTAQQHSERSTAAQQRSAAAPQHRSAAPQHQQWQGGRRGRHDRPTAITPSHPVGCTGTSTSSRAGTSRTDHPPWSTHSARVTKAIHRRATKARLPRCHRRSLNLVFDSRRHERPRRPPFLCDHGGADRDERAAGSELAENTTFPVQFDPNYYNNSGKRCPPSPTPTLSDPQGKGGLRPQPRLRRLRPGRQIQCNGAHSASSPLSVLSGQAGADTCDGRSSGHGCHSAPTSNTISVPPASRPVGIATRRPRACRAIPKRGLPTARFSCSPCRAVTRPATL